MIEIEQVIKEVSENLNVDRDIVDVICKHVFQQTVNTMKDP
jgi:CBS-domain-containing membrane protein